MPSFSCLWPTCTTYLPARGYCEACTKIGRAALAPTIHQHYDKHRRNPESVRFYNSKEWKAARKQKLVSCGGVCERCEAVYAEHVHHVEDIINHPDLRLVQSNLRAVCIACHNAVEAEQRKAGA